MRRHDAPRGGIRAVGARGVPGQHGGPPGQHSAAAARDDGIRRIGSLTWRAGAAGVVCSALIAIAFGHHGATQRPAPGGGNTGPGTIVIPNQPPAPAQGTGQVTSGAS